MNVFLFLKNGRSKGQFGRHSAAIAIATLLMLSGRGAMAQTASVEPLLNRAQSALAEDNTEQAIDLFEQIVDMQPGEAAVYLRMGQLQLEHHMTDAAEESFRAAIRLDPMLADAHAQLGIVLMNQWQINAAELSARRALQLDPNNADGHRAMAYAYYERRELDRAIAAYETAARLDPDFSIYNNLAYALLDADQPDAAEAAMRTALTLADDNDYIAQWNLASILSMNGKLDEAETVYQEGIQAHPQALLLRRSYAYFLDQQGRADEVDAVLEEGLVAMSDNAAAYESIGGFYLVRDAFSQAEEIFERGLEIAPNSAGLHVSMAELRTAQNQLQEAVNEYESAFSFETEDLVRLSDWSADYAAVLWQLDRPADAELAFLSAINNSPDRPHFYRLYGEFLVEQSRHREAANAFGAAINLGYSADELEEMLEDAIAHSE